MRVAESARFSSAFDFFQGFSRICVASKQNHHRPMTTQPGSGRGSAAIRVPFRTDAEEMLIKARNKTKALENRALSATQKEIQPIFWTPIE